MKFIHRIARLCAPNLIHRQLYPPPSVDFRIRPYEERDREAVLDCYEVNAPGRFPQDDRLNYEAYLNSANRSYFVADSPSAGVIACGGVIATGEQSHTFCYGMVRPEFQGRGVGSTMALARIVFATRTQGAQFSTIFAVPKSIGYYARFGFKPRGDWKAEDQVSYPCNNQEVFLGELCGFVRGKSFKEVFSRKHKGAEEATARFGRL